MSVILNIETSTQCCSAAVCADGEVLFEKIEREGMNHARLLAPFVQECTDYLKRHDRKPEAVAVSMGPGSYTGLRIGMSMAKGLCEALGLPLIGIPTLQILAVKAMFARYDWEGDEILVPMLDARRMEVYTASYDFSLKELEATRPVILEADSFVSLQENYQGRRLVFIGDGAKKAQGVLNVPDNAMFMPDIYPDARGMMALADRAMRSSEFLDTAYSVPFYLKEFQATVPKKPF